MGRVSAGWVALALALLWPAPARAEPVVRVTGDARSIDVASAIRVLEDAEGGLALADVTGPERGRFRPLAGHINPGFSSSAYWLRLELDLSAAGDYTWVLELGYSQLDEVVLHVVSPGGPARELSTGDHLGFDTRELALPTFAFRIPHNLGPRVDLYLRVRSSGSVLLPLSLWREDALVGESSRRGLGWGIYYGFLVALALYNLCLFAIVHDRSYLYYVGYLIALIGFQASLAGHTFQYLWPDAPAFASASAGVFVVACVSFAILFVRDMASVATIAPRLHRPMTLSAVAVLAGLPLLWLDYDVGIRLVTVLAVLALGLLAVPIVVSFRRGYRPARYLVLAIAVMLPGGILFGLRSLGVLPSHFATEHGVQLSTATEALVLSFALADRINLLRDAALEAKRDLARKLIETQDAERKRIAAELHDGLGQNVLVLANRLPRLEGAEPALAALARQTVAEIREVAHALHPGKLDRLGLVVALESTVEQALAAAEISGDCHVDPEVEAALAPDARLHVYRIVQEAVANAIKHGRAREIAVRVRRAGGRIEVRVEDDGVGLSGGDGLGLAGIEERAHAVGGTARVVSRPGEGVRVEVDIPVVEVG